MMESGGRPPGRRSRRFLEKCVARVRVVDHGWEAGRSWASASASTYARIPAEPGSAADHDLAIPCPPLRRYVLAVDVDDFEPRQLGAPHAGALERDERMRPQRLLAALLRRATFSWRVRSAATGDRGDKAVNRDTGDFLGS